MRLSKRTMHLEKSPVRHLEPLADRAEERGKKVYPLHLGQPNTETPEVFYRAIAEADEPVLGYTESRGHPELIAAMVDYYRRHGLHYDAEEILITSGASEALFFGLAAVTDPGDAVLVPEPYYASINTFCRTLGIEVQPITTYAETAFCLPPREEMESLLTERTRAILLSNPGNPTGTVYSEEEIRAVATIARQHDLFVIADEVYREFIFDDLETPSFGSIESIADRVILIDSISKRFSACGARIGSIASKNEELNEALLYLARARLSVPTLEQVGAAALYRMDPTYFDALRRRFSGRRDLVFRKLNEISGVLCKKSRGALYTIAKLPVADATNFARWLLTDFESGGETLHLAPAEPFYATKGLGRSEVRIAHVLEEEDLERAMDLLKEALEIYPGD